MPLIRIDTTVSLDRPTRTSLGALATQKIVQHWSVAPDKIQVLVTAKDPDSAFRAGVCPDAEEFGERVVPPTRTSLILIFPGSEIMTPTI